ncbi:hypothetical protein ACFWBH_28690 [Streptomyces sp. NPDC059999]|uniref:hypothetical protein n=1 Tax=Streptomyces sp. NPDC059999 TaxID=3347030 RepID=UPI0036AEAB2D
MNVLMEMRGWFGRPLWELAPSDLDRFFGEDQRRLATLTKVRKAQAPATYFEFLGVRHQADIHAATGVLVQCPVDEINRPRGSTNMRVRIPPPAADVDPLFAGWGATTCMRLASTRRPSATTLPADWPAS